jgi:hypothetical protein
MRHKSRTTGEPVSTHTSQHLLIGAHALPSVHAYQPGPDGETTVHLQVEAEHRTTSFDHTSTFTVTGPKTTIRELLDHCQKALDQLPPDDDEHTQAELRQKIAGCQAELERLQAALTELER